MGWAIGAAVCWALLAVPAGLLHGRVLRCADHRDHVRRHVDRVPDHVPVDLVQGQHATTITREAPRSPAQSPEPTARNHTVAHASYE